MRIAHAAAYEEFCRQVWAVSGRTYAAMEQVLTSAADAPLAASAYPRRANGSSTRPRGVAIVPVYGILQKRGGFILSLFGGTAYDDIAGAAMDAVADASIDTIVLDIDSPGGSSHGLDELWSDLHDVGRRKRMVAVANQTAASAAYQIATAAGEIVVSRSGEVGSIGVWGKHTDISKALEMEGVKVTLVHAGKYKVEGNLYEPLSKEARDYMQYEIDGHYQNFVNAVAIGRLVKPADVMANYGQGRMVPARDAVARGMADRIGTLEETVARHLGLASGTPTYAAIHGPDPRAEARRKLAAMEAEDRQRATALAKLRNLA